jgi:DNA-binding winged helix-turn-helix (wHTH) protein
VRHCADTLWPSRAIIAGIPRIGAGPTFAYDAMLPFEWAMSEASTFPRKPAPIDLAHQPDFPLGSLTVKPSTREIVRADGLRDVLEPRVMQVLVALNRARPNVVSRDDLVAQCWEGRAVGDDAINGAIGKLRRLSENQRGAPFTIETIPRIGYRLVISGQPERAVPDRSAIADKSDHSGGNRRAMLAGGVTLGAAAVLGGGWWFSRTPPAPPPPQANTSPAVASLIARANESLRNGRIEAQTQAAGLFQEAINLAPDNADAWGGLALADAFIAHNGTKEAYEAAHMRGQSALAKAMALDPRNSMAWQAKCWSYPWRDAYFESEQAARQGLAFHPDDDGLLMVLTQRLQVVGRMRDSVEIIKRAMVAVSGHLNPAMAFISIASFAGAGQLVEADQAAARGIAMFPRHPLTWLNRLYLLMFTGRAAEALVSLRDTDNRPGGEAQDDADSMIAVAEALVSGARRDIDKAVAIHLARAKKSNRDAENAVMFLSGMGRVDEAFAVARYCYLTPEANIQPVRFAPYLFEPGCRAMRQDKRFAPLMEQMGLTAYWQKAGVKPDYQLYG